MIFEKRRPPVFDRLAAHSRFDVYAWMHTLYRLCQQRVPTSFVLIYLDTSSIFKFEPESGISDKEV